MTMPNEDSIRYKYDPLPEEPKYHKKKHKKHVKSDHKHIYEDVCVDSHKAFKGLKNPKACNIAKRCKVCGRVYDIELWVAYEPPEGLPVYEVDTFDELFNLKYLGSRGDE